MTAPIQNLYLFATAGSLCLAMLGCGGADPVPATSTSVSTYAFELKPLAGPFLSTAIEPIFEVTATDADSPVTWQMLRITVGLADQVPTLMASTLKDDGPTAAKWDKGETVTVTEPSPAYLLPASWGKVFNVTISVLDETGGSEDVGAMTWSPQAPESDPTK